MFKQLKPLTINLKIIYGDTYILTNTGYSLNVKKGYIYPIIKEYHHFVNFDLLKKEFLNQLPISKHIKTIETKFEDFQSMHINLEYIHGTYSAHSRKLIIKLNNIQWFKKNTSLHPKAKFKLRIPILKTEKDIREFLSSLDKKISNSLKEIHKEYIKEIESVGINTYGNAYFIIPTEGNKYSYAKALKNSLIKGIT